jgi:hypothetical protein
MKWMFLIGVLTLLSCASANFNHGAPNKSTARYLQERKIYRYTKCTPELVQLAYVRMSLYHGCSECSLYFHRCRHLICSVTFTEASYGKTIISRTCTVPTLKDDFLDEKQ